MDWISIDQYDINANIPEKGEHVLVKLWSDKFAVAEYQGFIKYGRGESTKQHQFMETIEHYQVLTVTHWCRIEGP